MQKVDGARYALHFGFKNITLNAHCHFVMIICYLTKANT